MSRAGRNAIAASLVVAYMAIGAAGLFVVGLNRPPGKSFAQAVSDDAVMAIIFFGFLAVGALIVSRDVSNRIGWLFALGALCGALGFLADMYATYAYATVRRDFPFRDIAAWTAHWAWLLTLGITIFFIPLLFPTGRPLEGRLRFVPKLIGVVLAVLVFDAAFGRGDGGSPYPNPLRSESIETVSGAVAGVLYAVTPLLLLLVTATVILRFRRSRGELRLQLKWFMFGGAFVAVVILIETVIADVMGGTPPLIVEILWFASFSAIPISAGIAILKHRLYDIDVVVNRALVYGVLTGILALAYLGIVTAASTFAGDSNLSVAAATLAVAGLFQPLRRRIQGFIDQRFYRRKYDAVHTVEQFASRLRDEVDLDVLRHDLVGVVTETVQPSHVSIWLRSEPTS